MSSSELTAFDYFYFDLYEDLETEREKEIKKSICKLYFNRLENYCSLKFDKVAKRKSGQEYLSFEFSKLPFNQDNLRSQIYYSLQHPISDEIHNHLEIIKEKFSDLNQRIIITSNFNLYHNSSLPCYIIYDCDIDSFVSQQVNAVPHIEIIKKNIIEEIIIEISVHLTEKIPDEISKELSSCKLDFPEELRREKEISRIINSQKYIALASKSDYVIWEYYFTYRSSGKINYANLAECISIVKDKNLHQHFPNKQNLIEEISQEINQSGLLPLEVDHKRLFKASPEYKSRKKILSHPYRGLIFFCLFFLKILCP
jgi:hypothetical protein